MAVALLVTVDVEDMPRWVRDPKVKLELRDSLVGTSRLRELA